MAGNRSGTCWAESCRLRLRPACSSGPGARGSGAALALAGLLAWAATAAAQPSGAETQQAAAKAKALVEAGRTGEAAAIYDGLLREDPRNLRLLLNLTVARFKAGEYREAVQLCQRMLRLDERSGPAWLFLGASQYQLQRYRAAVEPLRRALLLRPGDRNAELMLAESLLLTGRHRSALPHLRAVSQQLPDSPRVWYGLNRAYAALGRQAAQELQQQQPESAAAHVAAGLQHLDQGAPDAAAASLRAALARRGELGQTARDAVADRLASLPRDAGDAALGAAPKPSRSSSASGNCGEPPAACAFAAGKIERALELASEGQDTAALFWQLQAARALAAAAYDRLADLPESAQLHELRARRLGRRGIHRRAARSWQQALNLDPANRILKVGLANALYDAHAFSEAIPILDELLASETSPELLFLRGSSRLNLHQVEGALPDLVRSLELRPSLTRARAELSRAYMLQGTPEQAVPHLQQLLDLDDDGSYLYRLAKAYAQTGQAALATAALEEYARRQAARAAGARPRASGLGGSAR